MRPVYDRASARSAASRAPPRPERSSERSDTAERSSQVLCQQGNVKSIRSIAGIPAAQERRVVVGDLADARRAGTPRPAPARRAAARSRAHSFGSEPASRGIRIAPFSATKSSSTSARISSAWRCGVGLGAAQRRSPRTAACRPWPPRRRRSTKRISGAPLGRLALRSARASSSTAAVPPAPSLAPTKPGQVLGVVVRGDARPRACEPGMRPTTLRRPGWPGTASKRPRGSRARRYAGELGAAAASPPGAGRARPGARSCLQRARGVEAVRALGGAAAGAARLASAPEPPPAVSASTSATTTTAGTAISAR